MALPITGVTELVADQSDAYITVNESWRAFEGLCFRVLSATTDAEPGSPAEGDAYIITGSATGTNWSSFTSGNVAVYVAAEWLEFTPFEGLSFWVNDENVRKTYNGTAFVAEPFLPTESGITASTTQTQGQGALTAYINEISTCATANDTVTLPALTPGMAVTVINNGAQTLQIFPASGENLGAGTNTAVTVTAGNCAKFECYSAGVAFQTI